MFQPIVYNFRMLPHEESQRGDARMKSQWHNLVKGMGVVFNVYPTIASMPRELHRFMNQPKSVEQAFRADANALRQDWDKVGASLRQAITGIERV
ncbi:MAG: hypothetical protein HQL86_00185 [Magnetococcales bacterium]|nr:hypothetical protein [Magnetococcales bacterium]